MQSQDLNKYLNYDLESINLWEDLDKQLLSFDLSDSWLSEKYRAGFWLHGTGTLGVELATKCLDAGLPVLGFTDNKIENQGTILLGLPVKSPKEVSEHIVICVYKYLQYEPLISQLYAQETSSYAHLLLAFPEVLLPHWCLVSPELDSFRLNSQAYKAIYDRIFEPTYKIEFLRQIASRSFLGILSSSQSDPANLEYLAGRLSESNGTEIILDLGAYDGDTAIRFIKYFGKDDIQVLAVEPDQKNFGKLLLNSDKYKGQIVPLNLLVGDSVGLFPFFGDGSKASNVFSQPNQLIPGMKIDDLFTTFEFTRVKIDVEGFEKTVLDGAAKTILASSVSWAISTYHRPDDLLRLPDYFDENYSIEVFSHSGRPWDTAYSFIPK